MVDNVMANATPILPAHIEDTVAAIAQLHADHYARATPVQRVIDTVTAFAGRPAFTISVIIVVIGWIALNLIMRASGIEPFDAPPFYWLQGSVAVAALLMTSIILTTQRREDELGTHREQLTLELAILSEKKTAKLIALFEEMRRDMPNLRNRVDLEATALSQPADPQAVLEAIKDSHIALAEAAETVVADEATSATSI